MNKMRCIILSFLISVPILLFGIARITVLNNEKSPVVAATVLLINRQDSTIVDAKITDAEGNADLSQAYHPDIILKISSLGYYPQERPFIEPTDTIVLIENTTTLSEVTVNASPESLKRKSDRFVFTPGSLATEVVNSFELLKLTPLLNVNDGVFSILGKGVSKVFINGRDPKMSPSAIAEMLKALPPARIKRVEIITDPGSMYAASYTGGIINIIVDNPDQGLIGSLSVDGRYKNEHVFPGVSLWTGYSRRKLKLSLWLGYRTLNPYEESSNTYNYYDEGYSVINNVRNSAWHNSLFGRVNASYDLSAKSSVGLSVNLSEYQSHGTSFINSKYLFPNDIREINSKIETTEPWIRPGIGVQGYYKLRLDDQDSNIEITADYSNGKSKTETKYSWQSQIDNEAYDVNSEGFHIKPVLTQVINNKHKLYTGYEMSWSDIDNLYSAAVNSNRFEYKEMINSGFVNWEANWSGAFNTRVGLRVENTDINGNLYNTSDNFKRNYTDLFPTINMSLDLPGKGSQNISFSFSRDIFRPFYSSLNPFIRKTSQTTYEAGNINLDRSCGWNMSMYYSFLDGFVFGPRYYVSDNALIDYTYQDGGETVTSTKNFGTKKCFAGYLAYNKTFGGFWRIKADASIYYNDIKAKLNDLDLGVKSFEFTCGLLNYFIFPKRFTVSLYYYFSSPSKSVTRIVKFKNLLSFSMSKSFNNGISISLNAFNLLGYKNDVHYSTSEYSYYMHNNMYPIEFSFSLNYVFGKRQVSGAKDRYNSPMENRFSR